jgi:hypothetical protein
MFIKHGCPRTKASAFFLFTTTVNLPDNMKHSQPCKKGLLTQHKLQDHLTIPLRRNDFVIVDEAKIR